MSDQIAQQFLTEKQALIEQMKPLDQLRSNLFSLAQSYRKKTDHSLIISEGCFYQKQWAQSLKFILQSPSSETQAFLSLRAGAHLLESRGDRSGALEYGSRANRINPSDPFVRSLLKRVQKNPSSCQETPSMQLNTIELEKIASLFYSYYMNKTSQNIS